MDDGHTFERIVLRVKDNTLYCSFPEDWVRILGKRIKKVHFKDYRVQAGGLHGFVDLLAGAGYMDSICNKPAMRRNPALMCAVLQVAAMEEGKNVGVMMPYSDNLKFLADWYCQLWAESLGKNVTLDGKPCNYGQTPVKSLGVTDQHSQVQLYTEGPYDKVVTFLSLKKYACEMPIPHGCESIPDVSFLGGHTMEELIQAENAATAYALTKAGRMNYTLWIPELNAFTLGQLLFLFELQTAYAGAMLNINTFNQPGVEEGKKATFALLGKAGYAEKKKELDNLKKDENKADSVVKKLQKDRKKYQSQLASKKKEIDALNREIARLIANAMNKDGQKSSSKKPKAPVDMKLDAEFSKNKGKLPWPADGPVVGTFGKHYHPVYKNLELPPNNGVDVALAKGSQVAAVFDGVVKQVIVMPGYNQCVLIQHGNYFTFYCKLGSVSVKAGDKVKTGQSIGVIDTINGQTQLHFQVWQGNKPQNPETWLR